MEFLVANRACTSQTLATQRSSQKINKWLCHQKCSSTIGRNWNQQKRENGRKSIYTRKMVWAFSFFPAHLLLDMLSFCLGHPSPCYVSCSPSLQRVRKLLFLTANDYNRAGVLHRTRTWTDAHTIGAATLSVRPINTKTRKHRKTSVKHR